jgi:hypothetical protein
MQSRLFSALGSAAAAWLITANVASAEEIGTGSKKTTEDTQADVSSGMEGSMPADISSGVEYRRTNRDTSRTGRNDQSAASARSGGGQSDSSGGGEGGEGGGGESD